VTRDLFAIAKFLLKLMKFANQEINYFHRIDVDLYQQYAGKIKSSKIKLNKSPGFDSVSTEHFNCFTEMSYMFICVCFLIQCFILAMVYLFPY